MNRKTAGLRDNVVWIKSLVTALSASVFLMLVLPFQTYLANRADYLFGFGELLFEQIIASILLSIALFVVLWISARFLLGILNVMLAAALVCVYLESGPLSAGLPEIDGTFPLLLGDVCRWVWDALIFVAVFAAAFIFRRLILPYTHLIALGILVMGVASLFDVRSERANLTVAKEGFALNSDIASAITYSPTRNVLMLVVDSMVGEDAAEILSADPELASHFPGFVLYRNNIGAMDGTARGIPGILTGRYIAEGQSQSDFTMAILEPDSLFRRYEAHGDAVYCMLDVFSYGYSNRSIERHAPDVPQRFIPLILHHSREVPFLSIDAVIKFRIIPFAFKGKYLWAKLHSRRANGDKLYVHEHLLFPALAACPVSSDPSQMFALVHSYGSHMPFVFDADGNAVKNTQRGYPALREAVSNVLVSTARLMDAYRERKIYDNSYIVIAGDHGSDYARKVDGGSPRASTLLMIKGDGWCGPLSYNDTPSAHINLMKVLLESIDEPLSREETASMLSAKHRLLRILDKKRNAYWDYVYDVNGRLESSRKAFDR